MDNKKLVVVVGEKALGYEVDTSDPFSVRMAGDIAQVAATAPRDLQEFFIRLAALHRSEGDATY